MELKAMLNIVLSMLQTKNVLSLSAAKPANMDLLMQETVKRYGAAEITLGKISFTVKS